MCTVIVRLLYRPRHQLYRQRFLRCLPQYHERFLISKSFADYLGSVALRSDAHRVLKGPTCPENKENARNMNTYISFQARLQSYEKRLLASSCPSVREKQLERIFMKFDIWIFFFGKICRENRSFHENLSRI